MVGIFWIKHSNTIFSVLFRISVNIVVIYLKKYKHFERNKNVQMKYEMESLIFYRDFEKKMVVIKFF